MITNRSKVVNLNKEELISNNKLEPYNFTNSCNNLIFIQKKKEKKDTPFHNNEIITKIETYKNGNRYEGQIKNGLREGIGTMFYNNGYKYEGDWKNGLREGKGIYYLNKENLQGDRYEG